MLTFHPKRRSLPLVVVIAVASFQTMAQPLPLDPAVRTGKLPNGFTYYIRHNAEPAKRVVFYLANKVGSMQEEEDQRGLAHFMEHMSFNGTKHFPHNALIDYLQKSGVRFGADINANTSYDQTIYELPLPADDPKLLQTGIAILRDWAQEATLDPGEIDRERGVVLEEKRLGKGASERMQRQYLPVILENSRYAFRSPIGVDEVLNKFKPSTIRRFYHDWYRPDLQAVIVVGDIDVNQIEKTIKLRFSDLKNPVPERKRISYSASLTGKNHFVTVTDKEMTATVAEILIKHPGTTLKTGADYRKMIIKELFNHMLSDRYAGLSREPNPPFIQVNAGISDFTGGLDAFDATVVAKPGQLENSVKSLWRTIEQVKRYGFTQEELERSKSAFQSQLEEAYNERDKTPSESYVREYVAYFLKGESSPGISGELQLLNRYLPGITLTELNNIASAYILPANRSILILAPDKDKAALPDEAAVLTWMKDAAEGDLKPHEGQVNKQALLRMEPASGKIISKRTDQSSGLTTLVLSNGIHVLLKPTNYKNDEVRFIGFAPGGTSLYADKDYQSASAANLVPSFGAGNYNQEQLRNYLAARQLSVQPYINERWQGVNGGAVKKDLPTALELMFAYFTAPRKDSVLFRNFVSGSKAGLLNRANDPASVFQDTVNAVLGNYNARHTGPSLAKLDEIEPDKAFSIYKQRFANVAGMTFVFVGSIDTTSVYPLIERYIASLPTSGNGEAAKDLNIHAPDGIVEKVVYKGHEPKATVNIFYTGPFDYSYENSIKMDALKEVLQIRLIERLREQESGVYSPSVRVSEIKSPQARFNLAISFGCGPENVQKLVASVKDEVEKLKTTGPLEDNLNKFKAESLRFMETQVHSNNFWLNYLVGQLQNQEDLRQLNSYTVSVNKTTVSDVKEMALHYLNGKNYIQVVLLPEK